MKVNFELDQYDLIHALLLTMNNNVILSTPRSNYGVDFKGGNQ